MRRAVKGIHVTVSGIEEEDEFTRMIVHEEIQRELKKLDKMIPVSSFSMHVRKYRKEGKRKKYSIHARMMTAKWDFFADEHEWDLTKATKGVLEKIEKEFIRKEEKTRTRGRGP